MNFDFIYDYNIMVWVMAGVVFVLTFIVKLPFKAITNLIKNDRVRHIVNIPILCIPFGLALACLWAYSKYIIPEMSYSVVDVVKIATGSVTFYSLIEKFFKVKVENPYDTESGKIVLETATKVAEDGKVDKNDKDTVKSALEELNKIL